MGGSIDSFNHSFVQVPHGWIDLLLCSMHLFMVVGWSVGRIWMDGWFECSDG
jgi:hypothetical protein